MLRANNLWRLNRLQDIYAARALLLSQEIKEKGFIYLENESVEVQVDGGTTWKLYGSPVSMSIE